MFLSFNKKHKLPRKKVLVLEGGGMRGIFLTGVLQSFSERNYFPWKLLIGSSAGALTGTTYTANQIYLARDAFFTKLLTGKFIHLKNILSHEKHILDLDWMIDTIIKGNEPLDVKYLKKRWPVLITAADCCENEHPHTVYLNSKKDDIYTALKATAAIPYLYKGFVEYQGHQLLDGGLLDPIPYKKAIELGFKAKDILVVLTRKKGYRKKEESFWIRAIYNSYYKDPKFAHLVESMHNRYKEYNNILDELESIEDIDIIYPPHDFDVERLTQDEKKIMAGFEQGIHAANVYLYPDRYS